MLDTRSSTAPDISGRSVFARWAAALLRVRWLVRAPIWLYRAGLGFVFGSRFLLLQHRGRRTGQVRQVMLEVVDHQRTQAARTP